MYKQNKYIEIRDYIMFSCVLVLFYLIYILFGIFEVLSLFISFLLFVLIHYLIFSKKIKTKIKIYKERLIFSLVVLFVTFAPLFFIDPSNNLSEDLKWISSTFSLWAVLVAYWTYKGNLQYNEKKEVRDSLAKISIFSETQEHNETSYYTLVILNSGKTPALLTSVEITHGYETIKEFNIELREIKNLVIGPNRTLKIILKPKILENLKKERFLEYTKSYYAHGENKIPAEEKEKTREEEEVYSFLSKLDKEPLIGIEIEYEVILDEEDSKLIDPKEHKNKKVSLKDNMKYHILSSRNRHGTVDFKGQLSTEEIIKKLNVIYDLSALGIKEDIENLNSLREEIFILKEMNDDKRLEGKEKEYSKQLEITIEKIKTNGKSEDLAEILSFYSRLLFANKIERLNHSITNKQNVFDN